MAQGSATTEVDPRLVTRIVGSYVQHHEISVDELSGLIVEVRRTLAGLGRAAPSEEGRSPAGARTEATIANGVRGRQRNPPSAQRYSIAKFWPSTLPVLWSPWRNAAIYGLGDVAPRKPITGIAFCCARAASGHPSAPPPRRNINSQRIIRSPRRRGPGWTAGRCGRALSRFSGC